MSAATGAQSPSFAQVACGCAGFLSIALAVSSCKLHNEDTAGRSRDAGTSANAANDAPSAIDAAARANDGRATNAVSSAGESFSVERWSFPLSDFSLSIEDVHMKSDLAGLVQARGAALALNGGFFGKSTEPLGLAISGGKTLSKFSSGMSGGVLAIDGDTAVLAETETFDAGGAPAFAIQCKPRLVVHRVANIKSDDGHRAERTALCIRDGGHGIEIILARNAEGGPSLFAFAKELVTLGCEDALNLDGGPSTGVAWRDATTPSVVHDEAPRGPIRHAIVIEKKSRD